MAERRSPLLDLLPGSHRVSGDQNVVTNYTLMPQANKLPGAPPPPRDGSPLPHLLGSGSKIPESMDSRMRSQFSSPDPAVYSRRKREDEYSSDGNWWSAEVRPSMPCNAYKSAPSEKTPAGDNARIAYAQSRDNEMALQKANQEKARMDSEQKRLMGNKEALLYNLCSNTNVSYGSSEINRVVSIVTDINKKLGLPPGHFGQWKLPYNN